MLLITSSDKRSWLLDEEAHRVYLGKWCFGTQEPVPPDARFLPYHWDDRAKFKRDYAAIAAAYESSLKALAGALNAFHSTSHGERYWRILLGPWLYVFVSILFDRWEMIAGAAAAIDDPESALVADLEEDLIPRDLRGLNPDDCRWNHFIYACAIRSHGGFRIRELPGEALGVVPDSATVRPPRGSREVMRNLVRRLLNSLVWPGEAFIIASYVPRSLLVALQLRLGQFPKFWRSPRVPQVAPDTAVRARLAALMPAGDRRGFLAFLWLMIPRQVPTIYLEGRTALQAVVAQLPWPRRPSVIFTANAYQFDEVFQAWAAGLAEHGAPLVIGQHGGFFGMGEIVAGEDHQVAIADRFLTWGWGDQRASIYPFNMMTTLGKGEAEWDRQGNLLLVTVPIRRVGFKCNSWAMGPQQSQAFLTDQLRFAERLDAAARSTTVLRIHRGTDAKLGTGYIEAWRKTCPDVEIDPSTTPIEARIRAARLFVYTYNSTGYLETLARNIPTVVFWNPEHWELREAARPYFSLLEEAGIYHADPVAAADHVNAIWDAVGTWWYSDRVQAARKAFCEAYARSSPRPIRDLVRALRFDPENPSVCAASRPGSEHENSFTARHL